MLCQSCSNGVVVRRAGADESTAKCLILGCQVPSDLIYCSKYVSTISYSPPSPDRLYEPALLVDPRPKPGVYA